jgi:small subunit ribosomal protein S2
MDKNTNIKDETINTLFSVGAHYGFIKSRRHPSVKPFIFGVKNKLEIFDLEKTKTALNSALDFLSQVASKKGLVLFVSSKNEAKGTVSSKASTINQPFVAGRWIGGTLTNFSEIKKRVDKMQNLSMEKEKGLLTKYTKKERLLIDKSIEKMKRFFSGLVSMPELPKALFVIDPKKEHIAVKEAKSLGIKVIAVCGSDCNINDVDFAIPANDANKASIEFFVDQAVKAYQKGLLKKD